MSVQSSDQELSRFAWQDLVTRVSLAGPGHKSESLMSEPGQLTAANLPSQKGFTCSRIFDLIMGWGIFIGGETRTVRNMSVYK